MVSGPGRWDLLAGYHADVHQLTLDYLDAITAEELARVVDTRWDPPVTAAVRLVSVLGDALQHLGQAGYVQGLAERHDQAWRGWRRGGSVVGLERPAPRSTATSPPGGR